MPLYINDQCIEDEEVHKEAAFIIKQTLKEEKQASSQHLQMAFALAKEIIIQRVLLEQEVDSRMDLDPAYEDVKRYFLKMKEHFGGEEAFEHRLKALGRTAHDIQRDIERSLKIDRYLEEIKKVPVPTDEEIHRWYLTHQQSRYPNKTMHNLWEILRGDLIKWRQDHAYKKHMNILKSRATITDDVMSCSIPNEDDSHNP